MGVGVVDRVTETLCVFDLLMLGVGLASSMTVEVLGLGVCDAEGDPTPGTMLGTGQGDASNGKMDCLQGRVAFPSVILEHPYWVQVASHVVVVLMREKFVYWDPVHPVVTTRNVEGVVETEVVSTVSARLGIRPPWNVDTMASVVLACGVPERERATLTMFVLL